MVARLRSISKTIPWWLTLKTTLVAAAWLWLPFWLFVVLAAGFYLFPLFEPLRFALPFLLLLISAAFLPVMFGTALILGAMYFLLLGIKDLILIHRFPAYESLLFTLYLLLFLNFFARFDRPDAAGAFLASLGVALAVSLLLWGFFRYGEASAGLELWPRRRLALTLGLVGFLLWQWLLVLLFLPLNFYFQTALLFLGAVSATELVFEYRQGSLSRRRALVHFSTALIFFAVILAANTWKV